MINGYTIKKKICFPLKNIPSSLLSNKIFKKTSVSLEQIAQRGSNSLPLPTDKIQWVVPKKTKASFDGIIPRLATSSPL